MSKNHPYIPYKEEPLPPNFIIHLGCYYSIILYRTSVTALQHILYQYVMGNITKQRTACNNSKLEPHFEKALQTPIPTN
jgi:hypothetical protein